MGGGGRLVMIIWFLVVFGSVASPAHCRHHIRLRLIPISSYMRVLYTEIKTKFVLGLPRLDNAGNANNVTSSNYTSVDERTRSTWYFASSLHAQIENSALRFINFLRAIAVNKRRKCVTRRRRSAGPNARRAILSVGNHDLDHQKKRGRVLDHQR